MNTLLKMAVVACIAWSVCAGAADGVDFTAPGGVRCRLTADGSAMWRLRAANPNGEFQEVGAVQSLARWMGETLKAAPGPISETAEGGVRTFCAGDGTKAVLRMEPFSLAFLSATGRKVAEIDAVKPGGKVSVLGGRLPAKGAVYGMGERLDGLNMRGRRIVAYTRDGYNDSSATYMAIPLFMTTLGGGVFVNSYSRMVADFGAAAHDAWSMEIDSAVIDAYVIATDRMRDVPGRYMELAGRPSMPDDWQYGPAVCRYSPDYRVFEGPTAAPVRGVLQFGMGLKNIIERYREIGSLPTAVVAEGRSSNMFGKSPEETAELQAELKKGIDYAAKDGIRYMIYMAVGNAMMRTAPGFKPEYEVTMEMTDENGRVKTTKNVPFITFKSNNPDVSKSHKGSAKLDITDPEAWNWYIEQVWQPLLDAGVRGAKIDFCEEMPEDGGVYGGKRMRYRWRHPEVFDGAAVHHAYPTFFIAKLCRELTARLRARGQGSFMALSRGGGIGAQRAPFMWAGDQQRDFAKLDDHVFAMLTAGVSGVPFMTYDMSGYHYTKVAPIPYAVRNRKTGAIDVSRTEVSGPDEEVVHRQFSRNLQLDEEQRLFSRGTEFTTYSPCIQTHGYVRHPFEFDDATRKIYVDYVARHRALVPEIAAAARTAIETGLPIVRPLAFDYQSDENTWAIEDEYLFCDRYLVAPVLKDVTSRDVYLPGGAWRELATGVRHDVPPEGKRFAVEVPIDRIPVFAKE